MKRWHWFVLSVVCISIGVSLVLPVFDKQSLMHLLSKEQTKTSSISDNPGVGGSGIFGNDELPLKPLQLLNKYADYRLQGYNPIQGVWVDINDSLEIGTDVIENDTVKITLTFNFSEAPITTDYRMDLVLDIRVLDYLYHAGNHTYYLNYSIVPFNYNMFFDLSDLFGIPGIIINHDIIEYNGKECFWFRIRKDKVPPGIYEFDPYFGWQPSPKTWQLHNVIDEMVATWSTCNDQAIANSITARFWGGDVFGCDWYIKFALYEYVSSVDAGELIAQTEEITYHLGGQMPSNTFVEITASFEEQVELQAGTQYFITAWADASTSYAGCYILRDFSNFGIVKRTVNQTETYAVNYPSDFDDEYSSYYWRTFMWCDYTLVSNYPPRLDLIYPEDGATDVEITPTVEIWANDSDDATLDVYFYEYNESTVFETGIVSQCNNWTNVSINGNFSDPIVIATVREGWNDTEEKNATCIVQVNNVTADYFWIRIRDDEGMNVIQDVSYVVGERGMHTINGVEMLFDSNPLENTHYNYINFIPDFSANTDPMTALTLQDDTNNYAYVSRLYETYIAYEAFTYGYYQYRYDLMGVNAPGLTQGYLAVESADKAWFVESGLLQECSHDIDDGVAGTVEWGDFEDVSYTRLFEDYILLCTSVDHQGGAEPTTAGIGLINSSGFKVTCAEGDNEDAEQDKYSTLDIPWIVFENVGCWNWTLVQTNSSVTANTTVNWTFTNASEYNTEYQYMVVVDDGTNYDRGVFSFTTASREWDWTFTHNVSFSNTTTDVFTFSHNVSFSNSTSNQFAFSHNISFSNTTGYGFIFGQNVSFSNMTGYGFVFSHNVSFNNTVGYGYLFSHNVSFSNTNVLQFGGRVSRLPVLLLALSFFAIPFVMIWRRRKRHA